MRFNRRFITFFAVVLFLHLSLAVAHKYSTPRTCPQNEFYTACGDNCQTECATLNQPCLIQYIRCPDGCYCNKGYARDDEQKCIPIENCPKNVEK